MKFAIIGTKPYYETDRILYEALKKGHNAVFLPKGNIVQTSYFGNNSFGAYFKPPTIEEQVNSLSNFPDLQPKVVTPEKKYIAKISKKMVFGTKHELVKHYFDISHFDSILFREMSKTLEWTTTLATHCMSHNTVVVEEKIGKEMFYRSKQGTFYKATSTGFPYPKTFSVTSKRSLIDMLKYVSYPLIMKKSVSSKGLGVYKCYSREEVLETIRLEGIRLPDAIFLETIDYNGDIRVFVVGDRVLGAMRREPADGQWKGNVAQGAKAYPVEIPKNIRELALNIVSLQHSEIIGVDIMLPPSGPVIIETNRAPQFQGFEASTGVNVAKSIVEYIEQKHETRTISHAR